MAKVINEGMRMQRRLSLLAPLAVVPCLILVFVGLNGGRGIDGAAARGEVKGVNMSLPAVQLKNKDKASDKMELYARAAKDSAKLEEMRKQDPYAAGWTIRKAPDSGRVGTAGISGLQTATGVKQLATDAAAEKLLSRINNLKGTISLPASAGQERVAARPDRMKALLEGLQERSTSRRDPELERADALLDKIIRIQHPDLRTADMGRPSIMEAALLERQRREEPVRVLQGNGETAEQASGFMEIGEKDQPEAVDSGHDYALEAVVDGEQTLSAGSTVALRLTEGANINKQALPAGQALYGAASISGDRLKISITSLRVGDRILPVAIEVFDLDGLPGIRVPGAISREVSKESAAEAVSSLGIASLDPSVSAQAANAGLQLAKNLASRKVRQVSVTLPADYRVLLRNIKSETR